MAQNRFQLDRQTKTRLEKPKRYNVIMHNDDVTTMDFVVHVLRVVFFKSPEAATQIMLDVHKAGSANVGVYPYDIAVSKVTKAMQLAKGEGFPLRLTIAPFEPEDLPF